VSVGDGFQSVLPNSGLEAIGMAGSDATADARWIPQTVTIDIRTQIVAGIDDEFGHERDFFMSRILLFAGFVSLY
jgi:hypothetical protein